MTTPKRVEFGNYTIRSSVTTVKGKVLARIMVDFGKGRHGTRQRRYFTTVAKASVGIRDPRKQVQAGKISVSRSMRTVLCPVMHSDNGSPSL